MNCDLKQFAYFGPFLYLYAANLHDLKINYRIRRKKNMC